jgi:hypothetical protein
VNRDIDLISVDLVACITQSKLQFSGFLNYVVSMDINDVIPSCLTARGVTREEMLHTSRVSVESSGALLGDESGMVMVVFRESFAASMVEDAGDNDERGEEVGGWVSSEGWGVLQAGASMATLLPANSPSWARTYDPSLPLNLLFGPFPPILLYSTTLTLSTICIFLGVVELMLKSERTRRLIIGVVMLQVKRQFLGEKCEYK